MQRVGAEICEWTIYRITSPSNKVYVGKTYDFRSRMLDYKQGNCKNQKLLHRSLVKYGYENHKIEIIEQFVSDNRYVSGKEMFWIRTEMTNVSKWGNNYNGLNLTDGGEGVKGRKSSEETKQKLREYFTGRPNLKLRGRKASDEHKRKMSESRKGIPRLETRGRVTSEETKKKQSDARKGKPAWNKGVKRTEEQRVKYFGCQKGRTSPNKGKKFEGTEDERKIKFGKHNIGNSYNKGKVHSKEQNEYFSKIMTGRPNVALYKPILQYTLSGEFVKEHPSIKSACEELKIDPSAVREVLSGKTKKPKKHIFKYKKA